MKIFNFEVEGKLDHHFRVEFDGELDGNSLQSRNLYFDPLIGPNWLLIGDFSLIGDLSKRWVYFTVQAS